MFNFSFKDILLFIAILLVFADIVHAQNQIKLDSLTSVYKSVQHDTMRIMVLNRIAYEYQYNKADTCLIIANKALQMSEKIGFYKGKGGAYMNIGFGNAIKGEYPNAFKAFQTALSIYEKIKDKEGIAMSFIGISNIHFNQSNYHSALLYYYKSLNIMQSIGDKRGISRCFNGIGNIYIYQKNYDLALKYHQKSLDIRIKIGNREGISACLNNIATIYYEQNNYPLALKEYKKSLKISEEIKDKYGQLFPIEGIALTYQKQGEFARSIVYGEKGLKIAQEINALPEISSLSKALAESYKLNHNYIKALKYYEFYKQTNDSVFNVNKSRAIGNLESKIEIVKKEREIEMLNQSQVFLRKEKQFQQYIIYLVLIGFCLAIIFAFFIFRSLQKEQKTNKLISQQKEEINQQRNILIQQAHKLEVANQTKDRLFNILGHDLRSPISSLEAILSLINESMISYEEFQVFIPHFHKNVKNMQNALDNLLYWSISQTQGITATPSSVNLEELIEEEVQLFKEVAKAKRITISSETSFKLRVWADINHLRLLIRNLINNAVKFTPTNGHINIIAFQQDGQVVLSVIDTGVGMSEELIGKLFNDNQIFTTYGTNGEKGTGLGLQLCQEIVAKNTGTIWVSSEKGKGSKVSFSLPMALN